MSLAARFTYRTSRPTETAAAKAVFDEDEEFERRRRERQERLRKIEAGGT